MIILTGLQFQVSSIQELYNCPLDCTYEYRNAIIKSQVDLCYDKLKDCTGFNRRCSEIVSDHKDLYKRHDIMQQKVETEKGIRQSEVLKLRNQLDDIKLEKERSTYNLLEIYDRVTLLAADVGSLEERVDSQNELAKEEIDKKNDLSISGSLGKMCCCCYCDLVFIELHFDFIVLHFHIFLLYSSSTFSTYRPNGK